MYYDVRILYGVGGATAAAVVVGRLGRHECKEKCELEVYGIFVEGLRVSE